MSLKADVDAVLSAAVGPDRVPGIAAAVGNSEGALYEGAFGTRAQGADDPMTPDTVVWLASMTKALTGAGAMQLVERGELDLDAPAATYLPLLKEVQVLEGFDDDGQPVLRDPRSPITLRHLLTHTSGYAYEFWDADIVRYQETTGLPPMISCAADALRMPTRFDPGEQWLYGIGIDFAGRIVEEVSGARLGQYLATQLFEPLGMTSTTFKLGADHHARLAKMHQRVDGALVPTDLVMEQDPGFDMGGGAVYCTVEDYLRFTRMLLRGGDLDGVRIFRPETVDQMLTNQIGELRCRPLKAVIGEITNDFDFFPEIPKGWGLSFQINLEELPTGRSAGSAAWAGVSNTYYWIDRAKDVTGVYLSQILPFIDPVSYPTYEQFETTVYRSLAGG